MKEEELQVIRQEIDRALLLNLKPGAMPIKKIETAHLIAYWVGSNVYRIDITVKAQ